MLIQKSAKRDAKLERQALDWMAAVTGEPVPSGSYEEALKNGIYLCKLVSVFMSDHSICLETVNVYVSRIQGKLQNEKWGRNYRQKMPAVLDFIA